MSLDRTLVGIVGGGPGLNGELGFVLGRTRLTGYDKAYLPSSRMNGGVSLE